MKRTGLVVEEPAAERLPVRELELHRRRSRVPWVYLVYHLPSRRPGREGRTPGKPGNGAAAGPPPRQGLTRAPPRAARLAQLPFEEV